MTSGSTTEPGTTFPRCFVQLKSHGTPGRPKARALIHSLKVHGRRAATRTP
jgi:hypothetical protein